MDAPIDAEFSEPNLAPVLAKESEAHPLAMPVVSNEQAKEAMTAYVELCHAVLTEDDYQMFPQWDPKTRKRVPKRFLKKSGVKKLQTFFGISVHIKETIMDQMPDGHFGFRVTAIATKRNGDVTESTAACSTLEDRFTPERKEGESESSYVARCKKMRARAYHDTLSTAETRAANRAVMNSIGVGGGEVTAEEMPREKPRSSSAPKAAPPPANDHTAQLRYAYTSALACFPMTPKEEIGAEILSEIKGHFDLSEMPRRSSDVTAEQLHWAGDYFSKLKAANSVEQAVAA
jgi:hypothetical protein